MLLDMILIGLTLIIILLSVAGLSILYSTWQYGIPPMPTSQKRIQQMIELTEIKPGMRIYDLGCGDGRILRAVDTEGIILIGVEANPFFALWARMINRLSEKDIIILKDDFFRINLTDADLIFCYLRPTIMEQIYEKIWPQLKPGCQIISHSFTLPVNLEKSIKITKDVKIYKYIKS